MDNTHTDDVTRTADALLTSLLKRELSLQQKQLLGKLLYNAMNFSNDILHKFTQF